MATPHIESKKEDIAEIVLMPGDPLRAKYIAEHFLENSKLVNSVRNMLGYTGTYKGKRVTVFASGMGIPSIGIYAYELYQFYDVKKIIRIGSCGAFTNDLDLLDVILVENAYTESNFPYLFNKEEKRLIPSTKSLTEHIEEVAQKKNIRIHKETVLTSDGFDYYVDWESALERIPKEIHVKAAEMESAGLFHLANSLNKEASCLLTVVDSHHITRRLTSDERQESLNNMILLALESIL